MTPEGTPVPILKPFNGLGLLSPDQMEVDVFDIGKTLTAHVWKLRHSAQAFLFDTIPAKSPLQCFENLMRLSLKLEGPQGVLEHIFIGLLRRSSLHSNNIETPLIHLKMKSIFETKKMLPNSHNVNQVFRLFRAMPKFELFRTPVEDLLQMVDDVINITNPSDLYCFAQIKDDPKMLRLVVMMPLDLFSAENIQLITRYLMEKVPHSDHEVIEVQGSDSFRLHLYFSLEDDNEWSPNLEQIERDLKELIKPWEAQLSDIIYQKYSGVLSEHLAHQYIQAMPDHYRVRTSPLAAVQDIAFLEKMVHEGIPQFHLSRFRDPISEMSDKVSLLHAYFSDKRDLVDLVPIFENAGLHVLDQLTTRVGNREKTFGYIYSFRVTDSHKQLIDEVRYKSLLVDLFSALFQNETENDPLNALVLGAGLDWRSVNVLQTYRNFYLQLKSSMGRDKINQSLCAYPRSSQLLVEYFRIKFCPSATYGTQEYRLTVLLPQKRTEFIESLRQVKEVAADGAFRDLFEIVEHTLRTNFFIPAAKEDTFISIKLDSPKIGLLPQPVPYREIYVHDVAMEAVHLRLGKVARGGLRWSDRLDDFRTEVLGLVKTQQVKNVVIVPVGSKGGFVLKRTFSHPAERAAESKQQYQRFIKALLSITDNIDEQGHVVHPHHVLVYDEKDPYLVVAADKGTATFSDIANGISQKYGFWLDDAFASGGSVGYDHKKEAITARGAWECTKLHFKEIGRNIETEVTTVVGIGDMSGDVFGNGMLLSHTLKLQAAFNHIHVFVDPNPDPEISWKERKRLFDLPGSTWKDYSDSLLSKGGGIFDRQAKEITLSPQMQQLFDTSAEVWTGEQLIKRILKLQVDLIWLGGIGTYIKASSQNNRQVGDQTNDEVRIDAKDCKALVIAEGANLGLTQTARIELNQRGIRLNTDAIDNSAGVNLSDYEVNLKILLKYLLQNGSIHSMEERNQLLAEATQEVSELVLKNNRWQHRLISMDEIRSQSQFKLFGHLISYLVKHGLNLKSEQIPSDVELLALENDKKPLPRPVLAVLQAYVKMATYEELLSSSLLQDPFLEQVYQRYFPAKILKTFHSNIHQHKLRREITGTEVTNAIINQAGMTFFIKLQQSTGASLVDITKAYLIMDQSLAGSTHRRSILLSIGVLEKDKYQALIQFEEVLEGLVQGLLLQSPQALDFSAIDSFQKLFEILSQTLYPSENTTSRLDFWQGCGFSNKISEEIVRMNLLVIAPDIFYLHLNQQMAVETSLKMATLIREVFHFDWLKKQTQSLKLEQEWEVAHQEMLLSRINSSELKLRHWMVPYLNQCASETVTREQLLKHLEETAGARLTQYLEALQRLKTSQPINLSTLTITTHQLGFLDLIH